MEARPAPAGGHQKKASSATFFVFGDDFADNGNLPLTDPVTEMSRQWAYPYGSNYVDADGFPRPNTPSGRFSNYKIQSDFIGKYYSYYNLMLCCNLWCITIITILVVY